MENLIVHVLLPSIIPEGPSAEEMTRMERETRKQVLGYIQALRTYMPGMEHSELAVIGPSIGFGRRESWWERRRSRRTTISGRRLGRWPGADGNRRFTGMSNKMATLYGREVGKLF